MNSIKKYFNENNLIIKNIVYINNQKILNTNNGKYIIKNKNNTTKKIHKYLHSKNYLNYLPFINIKDNKKYELYYYKNNNLKDTNKAINLMNLMGNLHNKTTTYEKIKLDQKEKKYESLSTEIENLFNYYFNIQDYIETKQYMSPAEYLLIRNISSIYSLLNYSKNQLEKWKKILQETPKERYVLLNGNINLKNYILSDKEYIINWENAKRGKVIYDFINFYKKEYQNIDICKLFEIYQKKYQYNEEELHLFLSLISIPPKVSLNSTNYINTLNVRNVLLYVKRTHQFISEKNKKEQETNKEKFE